MTIRKAKTKDINAIKLLLSQVLKIHADLRPDIFKHNSIKYTDEELKEILVDENRPIFVAADDNDRVLGYAFCVLKSQPFSTMMHNFKTLYIDDLCVDENARGQHIGKALFDYVTEFAKKQGCYDITLNVWENNDSARKFYESMGMFVKETQMEIILE